MLTREKFKTKNKSNISFRPEGGGHTLLEHVKMCNNNNNIKYWCKDEIKKQRRTRLDLCQSMMRTIELISWRRAYIYIYIYHTILYTIQPQQCIKDKF